MGKYPEKKLDEKVTQGLVLPSLSHPSIAAAMSTRSPLFLQPLVPGARSVILLDQFLSSFKQSSTEASYSHRSRCLKQLTLQILATLVIAFQDTHAAAISDLTPAGEVKQEDSVDRTLFIIRGLLIAATPRSHNTPNRICNN